MADTILYGGNIITMDTKNTRMAGKLEAVAISNGVIVEVGTMEKVFRRKGPKTEVIFLNQQTLLPGFIEPHQHALQTSQMRCLYTNISALNYSSYDEIHQVMLDTVQNIKSTGSDMWALFFGYDPELISDLPALSMKFLDDNVAADVPIGVLGQSGHVAWANTLAFEKSKIPADIVNPPGGVFVRDTEGNLTGQMFEEPAIFAILEHATMPEPEDLVKAIKDQMKYYASVGITTVTDLSYMPNEDFDGMLKTIFDEEDCPVRLGLYHMTHPHKDEPEEVPSLKKKRRVSPTAASTSAEQAAPPKTCCARIGLAEKNKKLAGQRKRAKPQKPGKPEPEPESIGNYSSKLWEAGTKYVADGSPHCGTAAYNEPFLNSPLLETLGFPPAPCYGTLNFTGEEFTDSIRRLTKEGTQVAIHAHGERACEQILRAFEQVLKDDPTNTCRHRMEHVGLMTVDQIARAGKLNIALSFFVDHLRFYGNIYKTDIFGEERVNRWTPLSEATKNDVTWTIHQDHPTFPGDANPFANMKTAITHTCRENPDHVFGPEYRVSIDETLKAYTINAAWQLHLDQQVGSITVGKKADLVVLDHNPYDVDPFKLEDMKVVETFMGGRRNNIGKMSAINGINYMKRDKKWDKEN